MIVWFIFLALSLCATSQPLCDTTKNPNRVVTFSTNYLCEDLCVALDTDSNITFLNKDTVAKYVYLPGNYSGVSECDSFVSERENITISPNQSFSYEVGQNWLRNVTESLFLLVVSANQLCPCYKLELTPYSCVTHPLRSVVLVYLLFTLISLSLVVILSIGMFVTLVHLYEKKRKIWSADVSKD